jgi:hypothetical protein
VILTASEIFSYTPQVSRRNCQPFLPFGHQMI